MSLIDTSRAEILLAPYAVAPAAALSEPGLVPLVQTFRRQASGAMRAFDKATAEQKLPESDYHISRKLDGEFTALVVDDDVALLVNPGGTVRLGLPLLEEAAKLCSAAGLKRGVFAGELYVKLPGGERARVHDVSRIVRKPANAEELASLHLALFDIIELDGGSNSPAFTQRWEQLEATFGKGELTHLVEARSGKHAADVIEAFETWVETEAAEGVVARSDEAGWYKLKLQRDLDAVIIGFAEGIDDRAGMLRELLLAAIRPDGIFQVLGSVGNGFSDQERRDLLSDLRDGVVESDFIEVNSERVAYEMVRPEHVVEVSCLDLLSRNTRGATIDRMVLNWDAKASKWQGLRRLPLVSLISPQFVRMRKDKKAVPGDVPFSRITDVVEVEMAERSASDLTLPPSTLLEREVMVKLSKGTTMVRKIVMWKTNKEEVSEDFPAYALHLTDFSPGRKDPLTREIRVSNSEDQIRVLYEELKAKKFVRGWKPPESDK